VRATLPPRRRPRRTTAAHRRSNHQRGRRRPALRAQGPGGQRKGPPVRPGSTRERQCAEDATARPTAGPVESPRAETSWSIRRAICRAAWITHTSCSQSRGERRPLGLWRASSKTPHSPQCATARRLPRPRHEHAVPVPRELEMLPGEATSTMIDTVDGDIRRGPSCSRREPAPVSQFGAPACGGSG
jgi:hypothetical protein